MVSAIRDDSPVLYMFHKGLQGLAWMASPEGAATEVPEEMYVVPFGAANVVREGQGHHHRHHQHDGASRARGGRIRSPRRASMSR